MDNKDKYKYKDKDKDKGLVFPNEMTATKPPWQMIN